MKTKNNVQKAILKSLAVVISFVLISFTVSAQGFWESLLENNTFSEIALAMAESGSESNQASTNTGSTADLNTYASLLEAETEDVLELEDWMTNETNFATSFSIEEEIESPIELENWMTDESIFSGTLMSLEIETEEAMELENWMLDAENFEVEKQKEYIAGSSINIENVKDSELELEPWMFDQNVWRN